MIQKLHVQKNEMLIHSFLFNLPKLQVKEKGALKFDKSMRVPELMSKYGIWIG